MANSLTEPDGTRRDSLTSKGGDSTLNQSQSQDPRGHEYTVTGTIPYMAPEVLLGNLPKENEKS